MAAPLILSPQQRQIVSAVVRSGPLSRADVARAVGRSRSSLWSEIAGLLEAGTLAVGQYAESTGGRKGELLAAGGAEVGIFGGVDIDAERVAVTIATLAGEPLAHSEQPMAAAGDPKGTLELAAEMLEGLRVNVQGPLIAIGVAIAAQIDPANGRPMAPPTMPIWSGWPVSEYFSERYGVRTFIDNDVNVMALAEAVAPDPVPGRGNSFLMLKLSSGLACGVVIDGAVFRGSGGFAGDLGHICVDRRDETPCVCGSRGCLETVASEPAILRDARRLIDEGRSPKLAEAFAERGDLSLTMIDQASAAGDAAMASLLRRTGNQIGFVLAGLVTFFNPSSVIVSTGLSASEDILMNSIRELIYQRAVPASARGLQVSPAAVGDGPALSAAVLAREGFLGTAGAVAQTRPTARTG